MQSRGRSQRRPPATSSRVPPDAVNCINLGHVRADFQSRSGGSTDLQPLLVGGFRDLLTRVPQCFVFFFSLSYFLRRCTCGGGALFGD